MDDTFKNPGRTIVMMWSSHVCHEAPNCADHSDGFRKYLAHRESAYSPHYCIRLHGILFLLLPCPIDFIVWKGGICSPEFTEFTRPAKPFSLKDKTRELTH